MPLWLLKFLPHIGIALLLGFGVWYLDHQGYQRAKRDAETRDLKLRSALQDDLRKVEQGLTTMLGKIDADQATRREAITKLQTIIQPTITREITREVRLSDPALGITDVLRTVNNDTRSTGACTATVDGGVECTLPAAAPAQ